MPFSCRSNFPRHYIGSSSTLGTVPSQGPIINVISRSKVKRTEPDKNVEEKRDER